MDDQQTQQPTDGRSSGLALADGSVVHCGDIATVSRSFQGAFGAWWNAGELVQITGFDRRRGYVDLKRCEKIGETEIMNRIVWVPAEYISPNN